MKANLGSIVLLLLASSCAAGRVKSDAPSSTPDETSTVVDTTPEVVEIEVTLVDATPATAAEFVPTNSDAVIAMSSEAEQRLRDLARAGTDVVITSRPRILVREGATAELANSTKVEYVKDYSVDVHMRPEPILGFVEEGTWIKVRPELAHDGSRDSLVSLELDVRETTVQRPIAEKIVHVSDLASDVRVQLPALDTSRRTQTLRVSRNGTVVFRLAELGAASDVADSSSKRRTRLVLVHIGGSSR